MIFYLSKTKEQGKISRVMIMRRVRSLWDEACEREQATGPSGGIIRRMYKQSFQESAF